MNKNSLLLIITIFISSIGINSAQNNNGDFQIGTHSIIQLSGYEIPKPMNIGWSKYRTKSDNEIRDKVHGQEFSINITPRIGYFITKKISAGLDLSFAYSSFVTDDNEVSEITRKITGGPFIRYYIYESKVIPFIELNYSIGKKYRNWDSSVYGGDKNYFTQQLGVGVGIGIPLSDNTSFDLLVGYNNFSSKETEDNDDNESYIIEAIGLKFGLTINI